ncbi:hypothetical protein ACFL0H_13370, partial [Thermodesulfobacteriota bacterium]
MSIIIRSHLSRFFRYILLVSLLICLYTFPAFSIDFITEEDFAADKSSYKDYPLNILFKKLAEGDVSEKQEIRNFIILKQVFDRNARGKDKAGVLRYKESFGIIKEINKNNLKLWVPETNSYRDYHVGIERIPVEKTGAYKINESNIGKCASVIYTLDDRIYKIKVEVLLNVPADLHVKRKDDKNIIGWSEASAEKRAYRYKLFINGELFQTVAGTAAQVPRKKGKVDNYFVKAVYKHGNILLESDASDVIHDDITAKELEQEALAGETYDRAIAALNPEEYEKARRILYDNRQFLEEFLDIERKENTKRLIAFFQDIYEGDRLASAQPKTMDSIDASISVYSQAEQKARVLLPGIDLLFLVEQKIKESMNQKVLIATKGKEALAGETYDRAIAALNP